MQPKRKQKSASNNIYGKVWKKFHKNENKFTMAKQIDGFQQGLEVINKRIAEAKAEKALLLMELGEALGAWEGGKPVHPVGSNMVMVYAKGDSPMSVRQLTRVAKVFKRHRINKPFDFVNVEGLIGLRK